MDRREQRGAHLIPSPNLARHTLPLLCILQPDLLLLLGAKTRPFHAEIAAALPAARVEPMLHYARREGAAAETKELQRVKLILQIMAG